MFQLRSLWPESKDGTFLTLINVTASWLNPELKSITHHFWSYRQIEGHKLIGLCILLSLKCVTTADADVTIAKCAGCEKSAANLVIKCDDLFGICG